jgi:hypothetical protein
MWVDAPDEINRFWTLEYSPSQRIMVWIERDGAFTDHGVARTVAYGDIGAQLGAIFDDIKEHGQLDQNSAWYQNQVLIKSLIPKPVPVVPVTLEELLARAETEEPHVDKPHQPSTPDTPAWVRYPGWKGYSPAN